MVVFGVVGGGSMIALLVVLQFATYAVVYLILSLRLGGWLKLFQWLPFGAIAAVALIALSVG